MTLHHLPAMYARGEGETEEIQELAAPQLSLVPQQTSAASWCSARQSPRVHRASRTAPGTGGQQQGNGAPRSPKISRASCSGQCPCPTASALLGIFGVLPGFHRPRFSLLHCPRPNRYARLPKQVAAQSLQHPTPTRRWDMSHICLILFLLCPFFSLLLLFSPLEVRWFPWQQ